MDALQNTWEHLSTQHGGSPADLKLRPRSPHKRTATCFAPDITMLSRLHTSFGLHRLQTGQDCHALVGFNATHSLLSQMQNGLGHALLISHAALYTLRCVPACTPLPGARRSDDGPRLGSVCRVQVFCGGSVGMEARSSVALSCR